MSSGKESKRPSDDAAAAASAPAPAPVPSRVPSRTTPSSVVSSDDRSVAVGVLANAIAAAALYSAVAEMEYRPASCDDASGL